MLKLSDSIDNTAILSLRSGGPIATVIKPIINPNNLFIEAWVVEDSISRERLILQSNAIRDILPEGFAVDDHEVLSTPRELIRLKDLLELNFDIIGLRVDSESGKNYGKISDYAFETSSLFVVKLYASQSLVKNFSGGSLSIDRNQIIEITNRRIIIEDPLDNGKVKAVSASII